MLGRINRTKNLDQKQAAASSYYQILVVGKNKQFETLLITDGELTRIRSRVKKNPEDEIIPTWWDRAISFLGFLFR